MKISAIVILIAVVDIAKSRDYVAQEKNSESAIDDQLRSFLENLKLMLRTGNDTLGIPVVDPFEMRYKKLDVDDHGLNATGELVDTRIEGLSDYTINNVTFKFSGLRIFFNLTWSKLALKTLYNIEANFPKFGGLNFFGKGDIRSEILALTFEAAAKLTINSQKVAIKDLSTGISVGNLRFAATGVYGNEDASDSISDLISSSVPYVVDQYQEMITKEISSRLKTAVNDLLQNVTFQEIIDIIG